jgi:cysteine synthase A
VLSGGRVGEHQIPGIGVGFVPAVLNRAVIDEVVAVSDLDAFSAARRLTLPATFGLGTGRLA